MNKDRLNFFKSSKVLVTFIVIGAVLFLVAAILLISNVDSLKAIFTGDSGDGDNGNEHGGAIPDMNGGSVVQGTDVFYSDDPLNVFNSVNLCNSFTWEFRVTTAYDAVQSTDTFTMTKSGDNYKVESSAKDIVYSDGTLYINSNLYSLTTSADISAIYDEIGITSLESVIAISENENSAVTVSSDGKTITVVAIDSERSIQSEYNISVEYGIVTYETHYLNGQIIRSVITDSVDVLVGENVPYEYFEIPTQQ